MGKRKQRELAADHPDGLASDTSASFGCSDILKNYYPIHPIWKSIQVAKEEKCHNLVSSLSQVPRGQRSKARGSEKVTAVQDAGSNGISIVAESRSQLDFAAHPRKPRNMRTKRAAEPSDFVVICKLDSEVICKRSRHSCRQSRRLKCSTTVVQKWEKLDSEKFEVYMESVWRRFTKEKKNVFTYLDSMWFSLYTKEPLKAKEVGSRGKTYSQRNMFLFQLYSDLSLTYLILKSGQRRKLISKIPLLIPKVPQQKYGEECGFFVLYYINLFLQMAPDNFSFSMGYPHFMKEDWFTYEEVESFTKRLDSMNETSAHSD